MKSPTEFSAREHALLAQGAIADVSAYVLPQRGLAVELVTQFAIAQALTAIALQMTKEEA